LLGRGRGRAGCALLTSPLVGSSGKACAAPCCCLMPVPHLPARFCARCCRRCAVLCCVQEKDEDAQRQQQGEPWLEALQHTGGAIVWGGIV